MRMTLLLLLTVQALAVTPAKPPLADLNPPATTKEKKLYEVIKDDPEEARLFLATRQFVRNPGKSLPKDGFAFRFLINRTEEIRFLELAIGKAEPAVVDCAALEEKDACEATRYYLQKNFKPGADPKTAPLLPKGWQTKYASNADEMRFLIMANITQQLQTP